jgi:hypothetical protein
MSTRTKQPARAPRAPADVQPSAVTDPKVTVPTTAQRGGVSTFLLNGMIERGEVPAPTVFSPNGTRYYSAEVAEQVVKIIRAKLSGRA